MESRTHTENDREGSRRINPFCSWCGGVGAYVYRMGSYPVFQCRQCSTGFVHPMPDPGELARLYHEFIPRLSVQKMEHMQKAAGSLFSQIGLSTAGGLRMLDVGGGGGYYGKAFETLGYGAGWYVDLDPVSCRFAANELKLQQVFNADATQWVRETTETFDFIHCRHMIEHLIDPVSFIDQLVQLLRPGGLFLLQCPNGDSLEYLAYPHLNIRQRIWSIRSSNGFSRWKMILLLLGGQLLHGMDPPRHLWAVSRRGLAAWARDRKLGYNMFCRHLGDGAYSPGYTPATSWKAKMRDTAGQQIFARIHGGTHAVMLIKAKDPA